MYYKLLLLTSLIALLGCRTDIKRGDQMSLDNAIAYIGSVSETVSLSSRWDGDLETVYQDPRLSYGEPETESLAFTAALLNYGSSGDGESLVGIIAQEVNPKTRQLIDPDDHSHSGAAIFVKSLPEKETLIGFDSIDQFVKLLGPDLFQIDAHCHSWKIFAKTGDSEIAVMSIFLNHGRGEIRSPGLTLRSGIFTPRKDDAG